MQKVYISACGGTDFDTKDRPIDAVPSEAVHNLLWNNPDIDRDVIDGLLVSTNDSHGYLTAILAQRYGIRPRVAHSIENICVSGSNAIITAASFVMAGLAKAILVVGGDSMAQHAISEWIRWDTARGQFQSSYYWASIITSAYKKRFGVTSEDLAATPAKNHRNAQDNPHAYSKQAYSISDVLCSRRITDDLRLLDCSRLCTGASAVLVTDGTVHGLPDSIELAGMGMRTDAASFGAGGSYHTMPTVESSAEEAYRSAGVRPSDIDIAEIHDAFSVCEPMILESLGMADTGRGASLVQDHYAAKDRSINPRGGIIAAGHPPGATGVAQVAEIFTQLQSRAGKRQIRGAKTGLVQNMAAAAKSSSIIIMKA